MWKHSCATARFGSLCAMRQTITLRPKSRICAPMPAWRRASEKRAVGGHQQRRARSVLAAVGRGSRQRGALGIQRTPSTRVAGRSVMASRPCTASQLARRITWLETSQPSSSSPEPCGSKCSGWGSRPL